MSWVSRLVGRAFCRFLEAAGPGFVKLGQVLSVRPDWVPSGWLAELARLQDRTRPVPFRLVVDTVERELGGALGELFAELAPQPLASASVAQVHRGQLHNGTAVAVKVLRPEVERAMGRNLALLGRCVRSLCSLPPFRGRVDVDALWAETVALARSELDLRSEAEAACAMARNLKGVAGVRIPRIVWERTSRRVLTSEFAEGVKISDAAARARPEYGDLAERGAMVFFKQVLEDGLFHADLHPANLLISPSGEIVYLDFGIRGTLSPQERAAVLGVLAGLLARDGNLAMRHLETLGVEVPSANRDSFIEAVRRVMDQALRPRLGEVPSAAVGMEIMRAARRHGVRFPHRYAVLVKALMTIEGTARLLHPEFSFERAVTRYLLDRAVRDVTLERLLEAAWRGAAIVGLGALSSGLSTFPPDPHGYALR